MMDKWHKIDIPLDHKAEKEPVPIISDATVASRGLADGRIIPLLIIDTSLRQDIQDMVRSHKHVGPGDVISAWTIRSLFDKSKISLVLRTVKPSRCVIILEFNVARQGGVVDLIIHAQGLYIQPGKEGDRLSSTLDNERMLFEVPSKHFRKEWDNIFRKAMVKDFRKRGLSRNDAKIAVESFIKEWRQFGSRRMLQN